MLATFPCISICRFQITTVSGSQNYQKSGGWDTEGMQKIKTRAFIRADSDVSAFLLLVSITPKPYVFRRNVFIRFSHPC